MIPAARTARNAQVVSRVDFLCISGLAGSQTIHMLMHIPYETVPAFARFAASAPSRPPNASILMDGREGERAGANALKTSSD
jgi:hypothetical protein